MAYLLVLAFVLAFMPKGIDRVNAESKVFAIQASKFAGHKIDTELIEGFKTGDTLQIVVDGDDIQVYDIYVTGNLEIIGKGKLNTYSIYVKDDATFAAGTTVSCSYNKLALACGGHLKIESGAKVSVKLEDLKNQPAVNANSADISGDLSISSAGYGIYVSDEDYSDNDNKLCISGGKIDVECRTLGIKAEDEIDISGGDISVKADSYGIESYDYLNISGGTVDINCSDYDSIYVEGVFEMTGGTVNLKTDGLAVHANDLSIKGGKIVSECALLKEDEKENFVVNNSINIGDGMYIEEPEGGKVSKVENDDDEKELVTKRADYYHITDANDEVPNKIVIASKPEPEPTPEPTPTPDPDDKGDSDKKDEKKYSNEWVDGKWYDANGKCTYDGILSWKQSDAGWWVEDTKGWYPTSTWQKIDGKWYYFCADGYMDYSEYRDGCWLGDDGAWVEDYYGGHWMSDSTGWWYEDASGWYPVSRWLWIDGSCYYFEASGYIAVSKYVDGCWVGADGAWVK